MGIAVLNDTFREFPDERFKGLYLVSPKAEVYSVRSKRLMRASKLSNGYYSIEFNNKGYMKRFPLHRVVALTFLPNPNNYPQVNHKDENPANNNVDNLEWCTAKYNMNYGNGAKTRHLKIDYSNPNQYKNVWNMIEMRKRPVIQLTKDGKEIARYSSGKEASVVARVNHSHILECCAGKRYKTVGGFIWKYAERE